MSATTSRAVTVGAVVLAQLALVVVAVWAPLSARLTGEQVLLRVAPVDPVDPFRGAYVELSYPDLPDPSSSTPQTQEEQDALDAARGTAYVPADPQRSGLGGWTGAAHATARRAATSPATTRAGSSTAASRAGSCRRTRPRDCRACWAAGPPSRR